MNTSFIRSTPITHLLIAVCVVLFLGESSQLVISENLALYYPDNPKHHSWQYVTSIFIHGGPFHLLLNMLGLWMFGMALEQLWGSFRFLLFFILSGIGAGVIYNWINEYQFNQLYIEFTQMGLQDSAIVDMLQNGRYRTDILGLTLDKVREFYQYYHSPVVGASGAIYGILVAYAMCFPNRKLMLIFIPYPIPAKYFVPVILLIDLFSGITGFSIFGSGVAHFAHVGGAIIGFILVLIFGRRPRG